MMMDYFIVMTKMTITCSTKSDIEYLRSDEAILTREHAERIRDASLESGEKGDCLRSRQLYRTA